MKIEFGLYTVCYFAAVILGLFSSVLVLSSAANKLANRFLGLLILALTGWLADAFMRVSGLYTQNANLYFLPIYYSFAFGPLLYFYVKALTNAAFKFRPVHLLHFVPVIIQAAFYWFVAFQDYDFKYNVWFHVHLPYTYRLEYDGTWLSLVIYLILSVLIVKDYQTWLNNNYSDVSQRTLNWLKVCLLLLILVCVCWLFEAFLRDARNVYYKYDFSSDLLCLIVFILGAYSYRQAGVGLNFQPETDNVAEKPTLAADTKVMAAIEAAMQNEKLYLQPELTLADLAKHLSMPPKVVSANINLAFGKPFNTYVNTWRVEEVKRRLAANDADKFTLLAIALESGFNSKTSFNRIFKDFTGKAPSDYVKK